MRLLRRSATLPAVAVVVLLCVTGSACGTNDTDDSSTTSLSGLVRPEPLDVSAVTMPDATVGGAGGDFSFRSQAGELLVVYFGYTSCPDVCPTTLADLRAARDDLGDDAARVDLSMITVDPERDTPEVLTNYLGSFATRYHALRTTDPTELEAVETAFGASSKVDKTADGKVEVAHSAVTYVVGPDGTVLVEWPFGTSSDAMAHDLRLLLDQEPV